MKLKDLVGTAGIPQVDSYLEVLKVRKAFKNLLLSTDDGDTELRARLSETKELMSEAPGGIVVPQEGTGRKTQHRFTKLA